jgi:MIP family channel proteins
MAEPEVPSLKKGLAELIGTFTLIYVGVLVITVGLGSGALDLTGVAFAHGLAIAVMVSATMIISGGQLNPAVTIGLMAARKITLVQGGINIAAQLLGGILGGYAALASLPAGTAMGGVPDLGAGVSVGTGILVEAILTFFLVFVIFGTAVDGRFNARIGGLAIGLTVALDILAGGPITGAAMNPARWLGAAVPAGHYANALVYWIGPILGGLVAALVYEYAFLERATPQARPRGPARER